MKRLNKLFLTIAALVMTIAIASTTAFAWFSLNTMVSVKGIEINVEANEGISISTTENGEYGPLLDLALTKTLDAVTPKTIPVKFYKQIEQADYDLLEETRPTDPDAGFDDPLGTYKNDFVAASTLPLIANPNLLGTDIYLLEVTDEIDLATAVEGTDYDFLSNVYYKVIDNTLSAYDLLDQTRPTDPDTGFDDPLGTYQDDFSTSASLVAKFGTSANTLFANVTSEIADIIAASGTPVEGTDYDYIDDNDTAEDDDDTYYKALDNTPRAYDLLDQTRPNSTNAFGTYQSDFESSTALTTEFGLAGNFLFCDVTQEVYLKYANYVSAPQLGVDFDAQRPEVTSSGYVMLFFKSIDTDSDEYTADPTAYSGYTIDDAILNARFENPDTTRYLDVTTAVNAKKTLSENNPLPVRGEDFDFIHNEAQIEWNSEHEFVNLEGITLGNIDDTDNDWYVQDFYFRSGNLSTDVLIDSIELTGVNVDGVRNSTPTQDIAANTFGLHSAISAGDEVDGEIEAAIRIAFFDNSGNLISIYRFSDGSWETVNADGMNMAGVLYNQARGTNTVGKDNTAEISSVQEYSVSSYAYLGTTALPTATSTSTEYQLHIKMVLWLEGKDGDCLDSIIDDNLRLELSFTGFNN